MATTLDPVQLPRATRVRYGVLAFACSLSMITYLDRVYMGSAAGEFIHSLGLQSEADLKYVFTAFTVAYAMFEVPSGWWGDVFGPRNVLIRIVLWWSVFTALTGLIGIQLGSYVLGSVTVLAIVRFLFGMGEAGAYPNITRALHNWFPLRERGLAQGAVWMSGRLMGGLTPLVWMLLVEGISQRELFSLAGTTFTLALPPLLRWRTTFMLFGLIGTAWCVLFYSWFRDRPEQNPKVNESELALIRADRSDRQVGHANVPWGRLLRSPNLWLLCLMYFVQSYGWYFNITYLPRFMNLRYGVAPGDIVGALYKGGPLWMGAAGCLIGGFLTDWLVRRTGNRRWGRRLWGLFGHGTAVICFLVCPYAPSAFWFFLALSLSAFFSDLTMGSSWAACQDIGQRYAAIVAGFMNMIGNLGGAVANLVTGFILDHALNAHASTLGIPPKSLSPNEITAGLMPGYQLVFLTFAAAYVIGVICWSRIDASKPIDFGNRA